MVTRYPWRAVQEAWVREGRGGHGPITDRKARWWVLRLDCDHRVERAVRYHVTGEGHTRHRSRSDALPAPSKVRCEQCPKGDTDGRP